MLMLSLKLILLAFFILLTTMSNFEEQRSRMVLESVATTFQGKIAAIRALPNPDAGLDQLAGASLADRIESLFKQTLPAVSVDKSADGTVLRIELPARNVFKAGSASLAPGRGVLLRRLAATLGEEESSRKFFELQFLHWTPAGAQAGRNNTAVLRTGRLARYMGELGVPPRKLSVGLWPVSPSGPKAGLMSIEIHLYDQALPAGAVPEQEGGAR